MKTTFRYVIALVLIPLGAYMLLTWATGGLSPVAVQPVVAQPAVDSVELCGYATWIPCYKFTVSSAEDGYTLTDGRGKVFACALLPTALADMGYCKYVTSRSTR